MVNCNNLFERLEFEKSQINSANALYEKMGLTNVRRSCLAIMKWGEVGKYLKINKIDKTCN